MLLKGLSGSGIKGFVEDDDEFDDSIFISEESILVSLSRV
jgi:hypothetical protein